MSDSSQPAERREFHCPSCNGRVVIPHSLPATTAPCPLCEATITSPPPPSQEPQPQPTQELEAAPASPAPQQTAGPTVIPPRRENATEKKPTKPKPKPVKEQRKQSSGIIAEILGLLVLILAGGAAVFFINQQSGSDVVPPTTIGSPDHDDIRESNYIRIGWQEDAYGVLGEFIAGTSVAEKAPYVHKADSLRPEMESFYGGVPINDSDTPADSFSVHELSEEDRKKAIFMLTYDQPPQFALKDFFRPLASLEVQYGIDQANLLLSTMARASNFAMEPVRVHAFFKRTPEGLKLDWEIFAQTKYRIFRNFIELPDPGASEVFRVLAIEDVPDKGRGIAGTRTYRLVDPANISDSARVNVKLDSEAGRALSVINWRGAKQADPITRTATVELEWTSTSGTERPELAIKRFICWEFLGLGGGKTPANSSAE